MDVTELIPFLKRRRAAEASVLTEGQPAQMPMDPNAMPPMQEQPMEPGMRMMTMTPMMRSTNPGSGVMVDRPVGTVPGDADIVARPSGVAGAPLYEERELTEVPLTRAQAMPPEEPPAGGLVALLRALLQRGQ